MNLQAIRRTLPTALSSSPGADFPLHTQPSSSFASPPAPPPHEFMPSQTGRPSFGEVGTGEGVLPPPGQPRLIRSDTAFAHATEVRFDDLTYTVQKPAERANAVTVGVQCLRFWSWPLACLLNRQPTDQLVTRKVSHWDKPDKSRRNNERC